MNTNKNRLMNFGQLCGIRSRIRGRWSNSLLRHVGPWPFVSIRVDSWLAFVGPPIQKTNRSRFLRAGAGLSGLFSGAVQFNGFPFNALRNFFRVTRKPSGNRTAHPLNRTTKGWCLSFTISVSRILSPDTVWFYADLSGLTRCFGI
jgi:hypothetical protein